MNIRTRRRRRAVVDTIMLVALGAVLALILWSGTSDRSGYRPCPQTHECIR